MCSINSFLNNPHPNSLYRWYAMSDDTSAKKVEDIEKQLKKYGVGLELLPQAQIYQAITFREPNNICLGWLTESSILTDSKKTYKESELTHLLQLQNKSKLDLTYWDKMEKKMKFATYSYQVEGVIDFTKKESDRSDVHGWNDIFIPINLGLYHSYHELEKLDSKITARAMCISLLIEDFLYYKNPVVFKYTSLRNKRPVDFSHDMISYISNIPEYTNSLMKHSGLFNLGLYAVSQGVFIREPSTRRLKNPWAPGLNTGLPMVPKNDPSQEKFYHWHDMMHHVFPDLILDGNFNEFNRLVYMIFRLISEVMTLTLSDMFAVHYHMITGGKYETVNNRHIYPVLEAILKNRCWDNNIIPLSFIKEVAMGTLEVCFYGNKNRWLNLISDPCDEVVVENFLNKYKDFFTGDFTWSEKNWTAASQVPHEYAKWANDIRPLRNEGKNIVAYTVTEFIDEHNLDKNDSNLVYTIFDIMFDRVVSATKITTNDFTSLEALLNSIVRYFMGQLLIFSQFDFIKESSTYKTLIISGIKTLKSCQNEQELLQTCDRIRSLYERYLNLLQERNLITSDDNECYKEIYPTYPPNYLILYSKTELTREQQFSIIRDILSFKNDRC